MSLIINTNTIATQTRNYLATNQSNLQRSLGRLASGSRIVKPSDDAGGLAVGNKLTATLNRNTRAQQNVSNSVSFLQVQDGALASVGKILDRMSELKTMSLDVTKNALDIANYDAEFTQLQEQLTNIREEKFNGISLFAIQDQTLSNSGVSANDAGTYTDKDGNTVTFDKYNRTLYTAASGQAEDGSISLNVTNLQFVLSIGTLSGANGTAAQLQNLGGFTATVADNGIGADGFITSILDVSVGQFTEAIERLADMRAENGAEQNRVMNSIGLLHMTGYVRELTADW